MKKNNRSHIVIENYRHSYQQKMKINNRSHIAVENYKDTIIDKR